MRSKLPNLLLVLFTGILVSTSLFLVLKINEPETKKPPAVKPLLHQSKIGLTFVATGLPNPTAVVATGQLNDQRLFLVDQSGLIRIVSSEGAVQPIPFLDIHDKVQFNAEMGLLGLAFSPNFAKNGQFFVNFVDKSQNTVVARFTTLNNNQADPTSEKVLLKIHQPYQNHNGGNLVFGPDSYLYIGLGDGGSGGDPENRAQNLNDLLGKMLRIDVDNGDPYSIPTTNPFAKKAGAKPEIWASGLRNPWRYSFDKLTGELWIADVGQGKLEEIDLEKAKSTGGNNYGWRCFEGSQSYNSSNCTLSTNYTAPIFEYDHSEERCSVTGGFVYRGQSYSSLTGKYFYADYCSGQLYFLEKKNGKWTSQLALKTPYKISTFGQDNQGELYLTDYLTGSLYQIQDLIAK